MSTWAQALPDIFGECCAILRIGTDRCLSSACGSTREPTNPSATQRRSPRAARIARSPIDASGYGGTAGHRTVSAQLLFCSGRFLLFTSIAQILDWLAERGRSNEYWVKQVPLDQLDGWQVEGDTGNLVHRSGRFYTIKGLDVSGAHREISCWQQPIIEQPEHGILGILVKEFDGETYCLLQAKMEPGNVNMLQLSPTVQATKSNYTGAHGGKSVPYLEYFISPRRGRVVFDALQSEQGAWFLAKRNRNMVVQVTDDVPVFEDFCWINIDQIGELLQIDNLINMDTRTVLSGAVSLRPAGDGSLERDPFRDAMTPPRGSRHRSLHSVPELLSWFTEVKARSTMSRRRVPLSEVSGWSHSDGVISHVDGKHFTVVGLEVEASNREVAGWSQPMIAPRGQGVVAFLAKRIKGTLHLLVQARMEAGAFDVMEMAPTVQCIPENYNRRSTTAGSPLFVEEVLNAPATRIRFDSVHSEEGGRFYHAQNRYLLIELEDDFPTDVSDDFVWMTPRQLIGFVRYGNYLNVEARNLVACLGFLR
ncbi:MAG: NDP-hexose 2,3-dehydratase [Pseudonocardiaceae bacterium]|nr:NDP-hexose 2,3-dehydratase [Pseudonocardiaceae bacterium]